MYKGAVNLFMRLQTMIYSRELYGFKIIKENNVYHIFILRKKFTKLIKICLSN